MTKYNCALDIDLFYDENKNIALRIIQPGHGFRVGTRSFFDKISEEEMHNCIAHTIADALDFGGVMSSVEYAAWEAHLGPDPYKRRASETYYISYYFGLVNNVLEYLRNNPLRDTQNITMKVTWSAQPVGRLDGWIRELDKVQFEPRGRSWF